MLTLHTQTHLVYFVVGLALGWSAAMALALWALTRARRRTP